MPAFVAIGQNLEIGAESASVKAFHTSGFLGTEYAPFLITDPATAAAAVRPPAGVSDARFRSRRSCTSNCYRKNPCTNTAAITNANRWCDRSMQPTGC